ncbi:peptidoglycan-binding domain-containing protein [Sorangium sp. So ce269]
MLRKHVIRQGEHLASIAARYGFANDDAIWQHPDNAELKRKRRSPYVLAPGDTLAIPDAEAKEVDASTGRMNRFVLKRTWLQLAVRLLDWRDQPLQGARCELAVDGISEEVTTDADGIVRKPIPRDARRATLTYGGVGYDLAIGHLDPVEAPAGLAARLSALGYWMGDPGDVDEDMLRFAIELFQYDHGLTVDGERTPSLETAVEDAHGC